MSAIKVGIIAASTKSTLEGLEAKKEALEISIAKEKIERPVISKEQIMFKVCQFTEIDLDNTEQKQRLINMFVNSVYVYDDKMAISFNYKDGDNCLTFDDIKDILAKKANPDNHAGYQSSPLNSNGGPSRTRTADQPVMSRLL